MPKTNMTREPGPMARYETATADGGWLTAWGWDCLAGDLREAGNAYTGARQDAYHDRAEDCMRRAEALRAKGGAL